MEVRVDLKLGVAVAAMTMVAGAPPQDRGSEPKPMVPLTRLVTNDDYPAAALRADEQGTVAVELSVSPEGRVTGCRITASSGSAALDSTTCRVLASRGRFEPARDSRGRAIASTYQTHLRWALPPARVVTEPGPATPRSMMSVLRIEL
jgi:protein TonB